MELNKIRNLMTIHKSELKGFVKRRMFESYPEYANSVTSKLLSNALVFMEGYTEAVIGDIMPPVNKNDLHAMLLDQGFNYILKQLQK